MTCFLSVQQQQQQQQQQQLQPDASLKKRKVLISSSSRRVRFRPDACLVEIRTSASLEPDMQQVGPAIKHEDVNKGNQVQSVELPAAAVQTSSSSSSFTSYKKAASLLYKACALVKDEGDISCLDFLALQLALASTRDELRGVEFDVSSLRVKLDRMLRNKKRTQLIVQMYKTLSNQTTTTTEERDKQLQCMSELISKPARVLARVMGTSDAVAALVEHGR